MGPLGEEVGYTYSGRTHIDSDGWRAYFTSFIMASSIVIYVSLVYLGLPLKAPTAASLERGFSKEASSPGELRLLSVALKIVTFFQHSGCDVQKLSHYGQPRS